MSKIGDEHRLDATVAGIVTVGIAAGKSASPDLDRIKQRLESVIVLDRDRRSPQPLAPADWHNRYQSPNIDRILA